MIYLAIAFTLGLIGMGTYTFSIWKKVRVTRSGHIGEDVRIITDLDRMVAGPVAFRWKGRIHYLRPMSTELFLKVLNEISKLSQLYNKTGTDDRKASEEEMLRVYSGIFSAVCDTISYSDIKKMNYAQISALYREIMVLVTGKDFTEATEKKTLKTA